MRITRYTDYSLRVLMYLALKGDELSTIREIADSYEISRNHLMKVVQQLNNKGYLIAVRGKNGGLRLRSEPQHINLGTLVRDTEQDMTLVECFDSKGACRITPACQLKHVFAEALDAFLAVLDSYSLADLLPATKTPGLKQLLNISLHEDRSHA